MKQNLRKIALERRLQIDPSGKAEKLAQNFLFHVKLAPNSKIAIYQPIKNEIDVSFLASNLAKAGHFLCLPKIEGKEMNFYGYAIGDELALNKFGIAEPLLSAKPKQPNVVLVPILAFDRNKNRLGYGGGYYDRYFAKHDVLKVGVAFAAQQVEQVPAEMHDAKMDMVVTEGFVL